MTPLLGLLAATLGVPFAEPPAVTLVDPSTLTTRELYGDETPLPFSDDEGYVYARRNLKDHALTNDGRCLPDGHPDLATDRSPGNTTCDDVLACWHPSDPSGTRRHLYTRVDTTALSSAPHGGLVVWDAGLVAFADAGSGLFARVFRCTQDGRPEGEPLQVEAGTQLDKPPFYYAPFVLGRRVCGFWNPAFFTGGPERVELACLSGPDDYTVHFPSNTPIFSGETVLSLAELDAHAAIPPLRSNADGSPVKVFDQNLTPQDAAETWLATPDFVTLPSGEVYLVLIRRSAATDGHTPGRYQNSRWLLRIPPDAHAVGDVDIVHRPTWPLRKTWPAAKDPDPELSRPAYLPHTDLLIFEANGQEYGNRRFTICDGFGGCVDDVARGTFGGLSRGFWVVPLGLSPPVSDLTVGYLSATDAFFGTARSYVQPAATTAEGASLMRVGEHLAWVFSAPGLTPMTRLLRFSPDRFDLDGDGLTAAEEIALGTSDLAANSDGDPFGDRVERDLGTSPTDPDEAPVLPEDFGALEVTTSALIQRRLGAKVAPDPITGSSTLVRSHAEDGPLCAIREGLGRCFDAAGLEVATFVAEPDAKARALAHDGRHLVTWRADGGLEALDLQTYALTGLGAPTLPELDTGATLRLFPLDGETVFLARMPSLHPAIWRYRDGTTTLLFDLDAAALAAGLTTPPSSVVETMGLSYEHFEVLGFMATPTPSAPADELVFAVQGHWRRYVLGLRPDGGLREIVRTRLDGLGDIDMSAEWRRGLWANGPLLVPSGGVLWPTGLRLYTGESFLSRPVPAFGALFVEQLVDPNTLVQPQQAGLHELVAFPTSLAPGETLVFISRWSGAEYFLGVERAREALRGRLPGMLFRVGLRGGMVPAWSLDPETFDYDFVEVTGIDLDRRHALCLADRGAGRVTTYRPLQSGLAPTSLAERFDAPGVKDCRWRADGRLSLLVGDTVLTRPVDGARGTLAAFSPDPEGQVTSGPGFAKGPGVDLERVEVATFVAGAEAGYARVWYDARTLGTPWGSVALAARSPLADKTSPPIALRPDGRVVVTGHIVYEGDKAEPLVIADPSTPSQPTTYVALTQEASGHAHAVAAVPWDSFADPWSGAPLDPNDPFAMPDAAPTFEGPGAPTAGVPAETLSEPAPLDDGGCGASPLGPLMAMFGLSWVWRSGRRRPLFHH